MFPNLLSGKKVATLALVTSAFLFTGQQDCEGGGEDGLVEPYNYNGYSGHLIYDYGTSSAPVAADRVCQMEGYASAIDYNLGTATPDPFTCWCIWEDGSVGSPCCSGSPISINVFDGPITCTY